jgi:hypothetical protein
MYHWAASLAQIESDSGQFFTGIPVNIVINVVGVICFNSFELA